jgi:hypothetical protein
VTVTDEFTVDEREYRKRIGLREKEKHRKLITHQRTGPWTAEEDAIAVREDLHTVEKIVMLQRSFATIHGRMYLLTRAPIAVCPVCQKEYPKRRNNKGTCSLKCAAEARTFLGMIPCKVCGREFKQHTASTRNGPVRQFCSKDCQHVARRTRPKVPCDYCGKPFLRHTVKSRFCSQKCMGLNMRGVSWETRSHCCAGHEMTEENTRISGGRRDCRTCLRERRLEKRDEVNAKRRSKRAGWREARAQKDADRLARWSELGKTWEALGILADEYGMSEKTMRGWLRKHGDPAPDGRFVSERRYTQRYKSHCRRGHERTPENTRTNSRNGSVLCRVCAKEDSLARKAQATIPTHCKNGHEYTPETLVITPQGWRRCRTCGREQRLREVKEATPRRTPTHCRKGHEYTRENTVSRRDGGRNCLACRRAQRLREAGKARKG